MLTLRRRQSAKPLGRRLVAERTQGVTRNSEIAQVLGRMLTLPIAVLREILRFLDTKLIVMHDDVDWEQGQWTGTQRMRNRARLRRRVGQTGWSADSPALAHLDCPDMTNPIWYNWALGV